MNKNKTVRLSIGELADKFLNSELKNITEFTVTPNNNDFLKKFTTSKAEDFGYEKVFSAIYINSYYSRVLNLDYTLLTGFTTLDGTTYKLDWEEAK